MTVHFSSSAPEETCELDRFIRRISRFFFLHSEICSSKLRPLSTVPFSVVARDSCELKVTSFDGEFDFGDRRENNILGMVGTGSLNRLMILAKPDLINGFRNATDKRNVGVHEFAQLVDKTDGVIDGVPGVGLAGGAVQPRICRAARSLPPRRPHRPHHPQPTART